MEIDNSKVAGKVLVKDGRWIVPESERPSDWRRILPEPSTRDAGLLTAIVENAPPPSPVSAPKRHHAFRGWVALRNAIHESAKGMDIDQETLAAGLVLAFGLFSREIADVRERTSVAEPAGYMERCVTEGFWLIDGVVDLCEENAAVCDIGFWLRAMAVAGILRTHRATDGALSFSLASRAA